MKTAKKKIWFYWTGFCNKYNFTSTMYKEVFNASSGYNFYMNQHCNRISDRQYDVLTEKYGDITEFVYDKQRDIINLIMNENII